MRRGALPAILINVVMLVSGTPITPAQAQQGWFINPGEGWGPLTLGMSETDVHHIKLSQRGFDRRLFLLGKTRNHLHGEPLAAAFPEKIAPRTAEDEIAVQDPVDTILQAGLLLDQARTVGHLLTEGLRAVVRKPHLQPSASQ